MATQSVGQIGLDLTVNKKDFERQMGGIQNLAKKTGKLLASAFAIKKLLDFGASCLELGSDLAEVQNVVDVTFPAMSRRVDAFAQSAAASFGLSETMAKQFTGTFGSMAKAFGFTEQQAYDMSTTLTGLAGDVASFYNISQDAAYTKLKSVFTGETESLKDLGIVMTQTALDSYALANGFGKTTAKMTEAEKVALRYQFVQEQLAGAAGDFARTSDGWANQVRILKLQFDSLKATIGQGLINVLTPVIKIINTLVGKLMTLANAFKAFTDMITGNKGTGDAAAQMRETAAAADNAAASTAAVGDAAAASARKMKGLYAFDSLNVASSDSGNSGVSGGYAADTFSMPELNLDTGAIEKATEEGIQKIVETFKEGFASAYKSAGVDQLKSNLGKIKQSLANVFGSPEVKKSLDSFKVQSLKTLGAIAGAGASVGTSIAIGITKGIGKASKELEEFNKEKLSKIFDNLTGISEKAEDLADAIGEIGKAFESEAFSNIIAFFTKIADVSILNGLELLTNILNDLFGLFTEPVAQNADKIREVLENFFTVVDKLFAPLEKIFDLLFKDNQPDYEESFIAKLFDVATVNAVSMLGDGLDNLNTFLETLAFLLDINSTAFGGFIEWIGQTVAAVEGFASSIGGGIVQTLLEFYAAHDEIKQIVEGITGIIDGIVTFITGVFSGDWEKAWDGITEIFSGVESTMKGIINSILGAVESLANGVIDAVNFMIRALNTLQFDIPDWVPEFGGKSFGFSIKEIPNVSIPRLAEGAYVRPNTPQLAMIGDNRHQGEIVAPEDKIYQVSAQAMWDVMQKFMAAMKAMAGTSGSGGSTIVLKVTGDMAQFVRMLKMELDREANRSGINLEVVYE